MPNDAKLGLAIGVGLVVAVAVLYFRKDFVGGLSGRDRTPTSTVSPPGLPAPRPPRLRGTVASTASHSRERVGPRHHTVAEGDTLFTIAETYYGDGERFIDLYESNRGVLRRPDRLEPGTVLTVPDLGTESPGPEESSLGGAARFPEAGLRQPPAHPA